MRSGLAFYKGPPPTWDLTHQVSHYGIRLATWSRYSHGELVLNGRCYSSSARDGGVRGKDIDLASGRWDVEEFYLTDTEILGALLWFDVNDRAPYDWRNIVRFVAPPVGHSKRGRVCFEAIGEALGLAAPHKLTANDLLQWARRVRGSRPVQFPGGV